MLGRRMRHAIQIDRVTVRVRGGDVGRTKRRSGAWLILIMTCCFQRLLRSCASTRAVASDEPPGANGMTRRTTLLG